MAITGICYVSSASDAASTKRSLDYKISFGNRSFKTDNEPDIGIFSAFTITK